MSSGENLILKTDSYKVSHWKQYPPGSQTVYSFFESRGGGNEIVFFGLQYYIKQFLEGRVLNPRDVEEADYVFSRHLTPGAFNKEGWHRLVKKHHGYLPLLIRAVPEGSVVPTKSVLMTVENTDPDFPWLTNWFETLLSQVWYPCTVATNSRNIKRIIHEYLEATGDPSLVDFKLHDFGYRGSTSDESAGIGGAAHLTSFKGTDTIAALIMAGHYYGDPMAGFSIPAAEHSTITSWGKEHELDAYRNMLEQFPTGMVAVVSDSYDIFKACRDLWGKELRDKVLERNGTLIIRPDSGEPTETLYRVFEILFHKFPYTENEKGFKVLDPHVRVIQGDGVNKQVIIDILNMMERNKWSADNIAFGSGGALLQKFDRDTYKFAFKCSAIQRSELVWPEGLPRNGFVDPSIEIKWYDVFKDPVTDPGKKSKRGRFDNENLVPVFKNGELLVDYNFASVRERAKL